MARSWLRLARDIALLRAALLEALPRWGRLDEIWVGAKWRAINRAKELNRALRKVERE